jgi:nucleoside phosphorylase
MYSMKHVGIFVALEMERRILIERWGLKGTGLDQVWRGGLGNVQVSVFSRDEMGRVPAAIATMQFLSKEMPDFLLIAGIAGGFERENVSLGNILIPASIVDLASRKIYSDKRTIHEFRPREFQTDDRLSRHLKASFDRDGWEAKVMKDAEWPADRRPAIQYGPVASLDEVVADTGFVDALCRAWPKLLGIEMEAGGVCAAAESFRVKAAVIRGVSDLADPSKSDNEWRHRAMKTVAHLIENLDFDVILAD